MPQLRPGAIVLPGKDAAGDTASLQGNVSEALGRLYGNTVNLSKVLPAEEKHPVDQSTFAFSTKPSAQLDLEDIMAGEKGQARTEASGNFLKTLINKLKKRHPGAAINLKT